MSVIRSALPKSPTMRGFTLIELMVALVVGLIVVLATTGFVVSVARTNSENIQVTRLTQELRAVSEVMARELRRARYVADPVGLIASAGATNNDAIELNQGLDCVRLRYDEPPYLTNVPVTAARSIGLDGTNIVLKLDNSGCSGGNPVNSPQVRITALQFVRDVASPSRYDITVSGRLTTPPPGSALDGLTRTFRQTVYVRSGQVD